MTAVSATVGLLSFVAVLLFSVGWRGIRSTSVEHLHIEDLVLGDGPRSGRRARLLSGPSGGLFVPLLHRALGPTGRAWLQQRIEQAGRPNGMTLDSLLRRAVRWLLVLSPTFLLFLVSGQVVGMAVSLVAVVVLPLMPVARARRLRQEQIERDLPDFLDVLAVTITAGAGFQPALALVAKRDDGPLGEEMERTLRHMENGVSLHVAFENLRDRNDSEALSEFVTAFVQSALLGTPLVDTLNRLADEMRRDATQRVRRQAARVAPFVTLFTSLVLVPATLILVIAGLLIGSDVDFRRLLEGAR